MVFWEIKSIQGSHQRVRSFQEVSSLLFNKPLSHELDFTFYYLFLFSFFLFFWLKKIGALMVVLYPRVGCRTDFSPSVWGGQLSLRMSTNKSLLAAGIEPELVKRSERSLPAEPSPYWPLSTISLSPFLAFPFFNCFMSHIDSK